MLQSYCAVPSLSVCIFQSNQRLPNLRQALCRPIDRPRKYHHLKGEDSILLILYVRTWIVTTWFRCGSIATRCRSRGSMGLPRDMKEHGRLSEQNMRKVVARSIQPESGAKAPQFRSNDKNYMGPAAAALLFACVFASESLPSLGRGGFQPARSSNVIPN